MVMIKLIKSGFMVGEMTKADMGHEQERETREQGEKKEDR